MPIFHVELYDDARPDPALPKQLADALGALFDAAPGHVWVRTSSCAPDQYAENGGGEVPRWAFVRVILRALPDEDALATRAGEIARIVSTHTQRSLEDVHVYFDPPAGGRIAFGGELVRTAR